MFITNTLHLLSSTKIHSCTYFILTIYQRYASGLRLRSISLLRWFYQHKDLEQIKEELTKNFSDICNGFFNRKVSIYFGEDKAKSILFSIRKKKKECWNIRHKNFWHQNQIILQGNLLRLGTWPETVGRSHDSEGYYTA